MNPTTTEQVVVVAILGRNLTRQMTVPARSRSVVELGTWGVRDDFGVEVQCATTCAAALVMWDAAFKEPNASVPVVGCVVK